MKIYLIEKENNKEILGYLCKKYVVTENIQDSNVIIVNKVYNSNIAFDIVDYALSQGKEIICIKNSYAKEHYVSHNLIKNGAIYV